MPGLVTMTTSMCQCMHSIPWRPGMTQSAVIHVDHVVSCLVPHACLCIEQSILADLCWLTCSTFLILWGASCTATLLPPLRGLMHAMKADELRDHYNLPHKASNVPTLLAGVPVWLVWVVCSLITFVRWSTSTYLHLHLHWS